MFGAMCWNWNTCSEPLPSNGRIFWLHYSGFQASCHNIYTQEYFYSLDKFMALRFMVSGVLLATRCMRILPMNQHAWRPITFGMKQLQFTDNKRCRKCCPLYTYIFFAISRFIKKGITILFALTAHQTLIFTGWLQQLCCRSGTRLWHSSLLS
jgi:hypothetical protein